MTAHKTWGFLTYGLTRQQIAAALVEYRAFARNNPTDPLSAELLDTAHKVRLGMKERRRVNLAIGNEVKA